MPVCTQASVVYVNGAVNTDRRQIFSGPDAAANAVRMADMLAADEAGRFTDIEVVYLEERRVPVPARAKA